MKNVKVLGTIQQGRQMPTEVEGFVFDEIPADCIHHYSWMFNKAQEVLLKYFPDGEILFLDIGDTDSKGYFRGELILYTTGLAQANWAILSACQALGIDVTVMNYDCDTGEYRPQRIWSIFYK